MGNHRTCPFKGHHPDAQWRYVLYSVYDEEDDGLPVCVDVSAAEAAGAMGIKVNTMHSYISRARHGGRTTKRWSIVTRWADEAESEEEDE